MQRVTFRSESNNERKSKEMKRLTIAVFVAAIVGMVPLTSQQAQALPSFARQTGQSCGACHTDFPGLTPFGRRFKLGGYTLGGGDFRTTPFPLPKSGKLFPTISDFKSVLAPDAPSPEAALKSYAA